MSRVKAITEIAKEVASLLGKEPKYKGQVVASRNFKFGQDNDISDVLLRKEVPWGSTKYREKYAEAWADDQETFVFEGVEYSVKNPRRQEGWEPNPSEKRQYYNPEEEEFSLREKTLRENKDKKYGGGKIKYAEGSMLVPPEMEAMASEADAPVDTYPNATPEEIEEAQKPDMVMEEEYLDHIMEEALLPEDKEYLEQALVADPRLSEIFDTVIGTAAEFVGAGEVTGPGTGISDSIPARLSAGEFVMTKKATDAIGPENLQVMMDEAERAYDGGLIGDKRTGVMRDIHEAVNNQMLTANRMPSTQKS